MFYPNYYLIVFYEGGKIQVKSVVFNSENITDDEVEIREHRVKVIIRNSNDEILLCKVNGIYHFVGGHPENNESLQACAKREVKEETGISMEENSFNPFFELKQYKSDYFGTGQNALATITYLEGKTDKIFDYEKRNLDEQEAKKEFTLEYIKADEVEEKLEQNREESQKQHKGFITTEMLYVLSEYKKQMEKEEKNISQEGTER